MYGTYEEGGLKLPHIETFIRALKIIWIKKLNNPLDYSDWKILFIDCSEPIYSGNVWALVNSQFKQLAQNNAINPFWKDVFMVWASLPDETPTNAIEFFSQRLWYNPQIQIDKKPVYFRKWLDAGIECVKDLVDAHGTRRFAQRQL